jgi:hypothetical protein
VVLITEKPHQRKWQPSNGRTASGRTRAPVGALAPLEPRIQPTASVAITAVAPSDHIIPVPPAGAAPQISSPRVFLNYQNGTLTCMCMSLTRNHLSMRVCCI